MARAFFKAVFGLTGVSKLYREVVVGERLSNVRPQMRRDLQDLLEKVNSNNPWFKGKFNYFLDANRKASDEAFFANYARLPSMTKQDYAEAGQAVMEESLAKSDAKSRQLVVEGRPLESIMRLRRGNFLMPMATGGSSALPLVVWMTKHH
ncbi:MAG: hypothetical protein ACKO9H_05745, partial [Planctomycetota bacterium]